MNLQTLPTEILSEILSYNNKDDQSSLSLVSKRIRAVTLKFILRKLTLRFPGSKFEAISGFLRQSDNSQHPRILKLDVSKIEPATWQQLISLLGRLTGLKSIECPEKTALLLLEVWDQLPKCELFVRGFQLLGDVGGKDYRLDPKFRLLTAPFLTDLECEVGMLDLPRGTKLIKYDDDSDNDSDDDEGSGEDADPELDQDILMLEAESLHFTKAVNFLTEVAPNLKVLDLFQSYKSYSRIDAPQRPTRKWKLVDLDLSSIDLPQRVLFENLQKATDFELLESLSLPYISAHTMKWLDRKPLLLPRLKRLYIDITDGNPNGYESLADTGTNVENFLLRVPPLNTLKLFGNYRCIPRKCFEHHSTLKYLSLDDMDESEEGGTHPNGFDLNILEDVLRFQNMTTLKIQVCISEGASQLWKMLQASRLETLELTLDCRIEGFEGTKDNWQTVLQSAATDEALVRSIYEVCNLEFLQFYTIAPGVHRYCKDPYTVAFVMDELAYRFQIYRVEGQVRVRKVSRGPRPLPPPEATIDNLDPDFMEIFRSIWPSKGGDWRDDWHSLPLILD